LPLDWQQEGEVSQAQRNSVRGLMEDLRVVGLSSLFESFCSFGVAHCLWLRCSRRRLHALSKCQWCSWCMFGGVCRVVLMSSRFFGFVGGSMCFVCIGFRPVFHKLTGQLSSS
jgi:hypothetical protein